MGRDDSRSRSRPKSFQPLGEDSYHWRIAWMAVETGISPNELAKLEPRMFWTLGKYLEFKAQRLQRKR